MLLPGEAAGSCAGGHADGFPRTRASHCPSRLALPMQEGQARAHHTAHAGLHPPSTPVCWVSCSHPSPPSPPSLQPRHTHTRMPHWPSHTQQCTRGRTVVAVQVAGHWEGEAACELVVLHRECLQGIGEGPVLGQRAREVVAARRKGCQVAQPRQRGQRAVQGVVGLRRTWDSTGAAMWLPRRAAVCDWKWGDTGSIWWLPMSAGIVGQPGFGGGRLSRPGVCSQQASRAGRLAGCRQEAQGCGGTVKLGRPGRVRPAAFQTFQRPTLARLRCLHPSLPDPAKCRAGGHAPRAADRTRVL